MLTVPATEAALLPAPLPPPPVPPFAPAIPEVAPPPPPPARVTDEPVIVDATPVPP